MKKIEKELILKSVLLHKEILNENSRLHNRFQNIDKFNDTSKTLMITYVLSYMKKYKEYLKYLKILEQFSISTKNHSNDLKLDFKKHNITKNIINEYLK
jgi:hypothetical protein